MHMQGYDFKGKYPTSEGRKYSLGNGLWYEINCGFFNRHRTLTGCQNTLYHSDNIKCAKNEIKINKIILTSHIKYIGNVEQFYSKNKLDRKYNATKSRTHHSFSKTQAFSFFS